MSLSSEFTKKLIAWYKLERAHIPVPGRSERDPYPIWIAEVMLQQTQVETVWPYYRRWLDAFPDVASLARAELDQVLKLWEGLGYYSRARNIHKAAKSIVNDYRGEFPRTSRTLITLPGIGPYTSAAIASMAFQEAVPLLDGNVLRVMTRLLRISSVVSLASTKEKIKVDLAEFMDKNQPGQFNQALMDLGRVICLPRRPLCSDCPLNTFCQAYAAGAVERYPVKPLKAEMPHYNIVIGLIRKQGSLLIQRRPETGLLGGLWEFPGGKVEPGEDQKEALLREIREETALQVDINEKIATIKHAYTHFKITLTAYWCDWKSGTAQSLAATENRWVTQDKLQAFAFPKANLKILEKIQD